MNDHKSTKDERGQSADGKDDLTPEVLSGLYAENVPDNIPVGTVGAILFSLAGAAAWYFFYEYDILVALSGLLGGICAVYGYKQFAGRITRMGSVISAAASVVTLTAAWYMRIAKNLSDMSFIFVEAGEPDSAFTFSEALTEAFHMIMKGAVEQSYMTDLALGVILCIVGTVIGVKSVTSDGIL